jgi:hypothetical protein
MNHGVKMTQLNLVALIAASLSLNLAACMEKDRSDSATPASLAPTSQTQSAMQSPTAGQETAGVTRNAIPQSTANSEIGTAGGAGGDGGVALGTGGSAGHGGTAGHGGSGGKH